MNNMRYQDQLNRMKKLKFEGLENIDVADAMYFSFYEITANRKDIKACLLRMICYLMAIDVDTVCDEKPQVAFVYSNSYKRRTEYQKAINIISSTFSQKMRFDPGKKKLQLQNIAYIPRLISWLRTFRKEYEVKESIYYASMLLFALTNADYIEKRIIKYRCHSVVVLSDMHLIDSILVQKCNEDGITTTTLQHGNFELDEPFVLSKSKNFLTYGTYSKNKAIKYGVNPEKLVEVGLLKMLGTSVPQKICLQAGSVVRRIGIILSGGEFTESDTAMINFMSIFARKHGYSVVVKCHPNFGTENYPDVDWEKITTVYNQELNVEELKKHIDLAIVMQSTVFFEYILTLFPTLVYVDQEDTFVPEVTWCKFRTENELQKLIDQLNTDGNTFERKMLDLRSYISITDGVEEAYHLAISRISQIDM